MYIEEVFFDIEWECGYATVHKTANKRGHSLTADIKLMLPGEKFNNATFKCKVSLQPRLRDFRRKCREVDQDLIDNAAIDLPGWHEEVFERLYGNMVRHQTDNPGWEKKYMRFGIGRQSNKWASTARYAPSIAGVMAGYDPGTGMLGVSVGKFSTVIDLNKASISVRQEAAGVAAAGWVKHRPIVYSDDSIVAANDMKSKLRSAIRAQQPKTS